MLMQRTVAMVAALFGVVTVFEGGRVLAGADPGFVVFRPLLLFNVAMGVVYVLAGAQAWRDARRGRAWAGAIAILNLLVLAGITAAYVAGAGVATRSLAAMSFRTVVWGGLWLALSRVARRPASFARQAEREPADVGWVIRPAEDEPVTVASFFAIDHDDIDRLLDEFRAAKAGDLPAAPAMYREFRRRLERHIGWEEDILFPLFERLSGLTNQGPTVVMRAEHRTIRGLLESIDTTLDDDATSIDADEAALLDALAAHNVKEENVLYPLIDRQVSPTERDGVFARVREATAGA